MNTEQNNTNPYADANLALGLNIDSYGPIAAKLMDISSRLNNFFHCDFYDEDICCYRTAFTLMNANQPIDVVLAVLPEQRMKVCEPQRKALFKILKSNPNLIKAYIIERLNDACLYSECRYLISMDSAS